MMILLDIICPPINGQFPCGQKTGDGAASRIGTLRTGEVRKAEAMFRAMLEWRHSFRVDVPWAKAKRV